MAKKTIRLNEENLRNIISQCINEALAEHRWDYLNSALADYQGTDSKESHDRVEKIRGKRGKYGGDPKYRIPGNSFIRTGKDGKAALNTNDTPVMGARKRFGGDDAKSTMGSFNELVKPLCDKKLKALETNDKAWKALDDLYFAMYKAYQEWADSHRGDSFKGDKGK